MIDLDGRDKKSLLADDVFEELFSIEDEIERANRQNEIIYRAKELRVQRLADDKLKAWKMKAKRQIVKTMSNKLFHNVTNFFGVGCENPKPDEYHEFDCGSWIAGEGGIYSADASKFGQVACRHPIFPLRVLKNLETGEEQVVLAYKIRGHWIEHTVQRVLISKASTIVELARYGVSVTSETAKYLASYLMEVLDYNEDMIPLRESTSKLGWNKGKLFIPYDDGIEFDGETRFMQLFNSVSESGRFEDWLSTMKGIRTRDNIEPRVALAASFASVLIKPLGILPFIVDEHGQTEGGKTVSLMVGASVWGDPGEGNFIGDFKTTDVALEVRCDLLNNLPLILDDTSKATNRIRDNFESLVYDLCSGKGKSRSNKELGTNRECTWQNVTICNGERPLSEYVEQGGAINRILEIQCGDVIFSDPRAVAETVKKNYGFAGRMFVEHVREMDVAVIKGLHKHYEMELTNSETMQKQVSALACILTADAIATDCIFHDGRALTPAEVKDVLTQKSYVSEGARCYDYIMDCLDIYEQHFFGTAANSGFNGDIWGEIINADSGQWVYFIPSAFDELLRRGNFYRGQFIPWARVRKLIDTDEGKNSVKTARFGAAKKPQKIIAVRIDKEFTEKYDSDIDFD